MLPSTQSISFMDLERCVHFIVINVNGVERGQTYRHVVYVEKNLIMLIGYKLSVHREKKRHFIMQAMYSTYAPIRQKRRSHSEIHTHGLPLIGSTQGAVASQPFYCFRPGKDTTKKELNVAKRPLHKIIKYLQYTHDKVRVLSFIVRSFTYGGAKNRVLFYF